MNLALGPERQIGSVRLAVVSQSEVAAIPLGLGLFLRGRKTPVLVLFDHAGTVSAQSLTGQDLPMAHVRHLCPDALAAFTARPTATTG